MTPAERFWRKTVSVSGGCVLWLGCADKDGYGKYADTRAHRWIYRHVFGSVPRMLMHSCDRPGCVALQHLSPGDEHMNMQDALNKGRRALGVDHPNAKITEVQAYEIKGRLARGERPKEIQLAMGVSRYVITAIVRGRTWKHLKAMP